MEGTENMHEIVSRRGEGRSVRNPVSGAIEFKARADETGGALTAFESAMPAGEGPPLHTHADQNEVLYFIDGRFRVKIGDAVHEAPAGSFVFIPKGMPHTWQNVGDAPGRLLAMFISAAPGMEQFFERFAAVTRDESAAAAFATLGDAAGMKVLGPPLAQSDPVS